MNYEIKRLSDLVLEVRTRYKSGDVFPFLLLSDLHFDHPYCDRESLFRVMNEAKKQKAKILLNGDTLCLMQAKGDKRGGKSSVRPEHKTNTYFDTVIEDTAEKLSPWAKDIILLADGNHETAVTRYKEIDPLNLLAYRLNNEFGGNVTRAGYHGFIKFVFEHESGGAIRSFLLYHHHGKFGGIVTKGVLGVSRHGLVIPQANVIWTGHTHTLWHVTQPTLMVDQTGNTHERLVHHIKTGTWKGEFNKPGGFGVERIAVPSSQGGFWMRIVFRNAKVNLQFTMAQ